MSDTSLNKIIRYGTTADRIAFIPDPAVGSQVLYIWFDEDNQPDTFVWDGSAWIQINTTAGGGTGDVVGPGVAVNNDIVVFDGTTGKLIKDGAQTIAQVIAAAVAVLSGLDFLTHTDESATLPSSRTLLAGSNITFNDTVANQRTISSTAGGTGDVVGPAVAVDDRIATFDGTTGKLIQDGGQTIAQVITAAGDVDGPVVAVTDRIATFDGTTGKLIKDGGQTIAQVIAAAGDVDGPASAVTDRVATFDGTTGKLIKDGGSTIADIIAAGGGGSGDVVGPASAVNSNLALFDGSTGKLIGDSGFSIASLVAGLATPKILRINISNAQMQTWSSVPLELIPAPGANKINVILHHSVETNSTVNPGSTPTASVFYNGDTTNLLVGTWQGQFNVTGKRLLFDTPSATPQWVYSTFDPRNKSVVMKGSADLGGGTVTLTITLAYYVADVA